MKQKLKLIFLLSLGLSACQPEKPTQAFKEKKASHQKAKQPSLIISIQPFSDISPMLTDYVFKELKKVYPFCEVKQPIQLPKSAYYKPRNRYRADTLIGFLDRLNKNGHVTIGLTCKDISTSVHGYSDWGVMGLGFMPGDACVVSTHRLKKGNMNIQYAKVAKHELGHTQGLPHCPVKTCLMADAEGKNPTDKETGFCPKCKARLQKKGWKL